MGGLVNGEDLCVWPDGTQCFRDELADYTHMSDDYEIVAYGSPRWHELVE